MITETPTIGYTEQEGFVAQMGLKWGDLRMYTKNMLWIGNAEKHAIMTDFFALAERLGAPNIDEIKRRVKYKGWHQH